MEPPSDGKGGELLLAPGAGYADIISPTTQSLLDANCIDPSPTATFQYDGLLQQLQSAMQLDDNELLGLEKTRLSAGQSQARSETSQMSISTSRIDVEQSNIVTPQHIISDSHHSFTAALSPPKTVFVPRPLGSASSLGGSGYIPRPLGRKDSAGSASTPPRSLGSSVEDTGVVLSRNRQTGVSSSSVDLQFHDSSAALPGRPGLAATLGEVSMSSVGPGLSRSDLEQQQQNDDDDSGTLETLSPSITIGGLVSADVSPAAGEEHPPLVSSGGVAAAAISIVTAQHEQLQLQHSFKQGTISTSQRQLYVGYVSPAGSVSGASNASLSAGAAAVAATADAIEVPTSPGASTTADAAAAETIVQQHNGASEVHLHHGQRQAAQAERAEQTQQPQQHQRRQQAEEAHPSPAAADAHDNADGSTTRPPLHQHAQQQQQGAVTQAPRQQQPQPHQQPQRSSLTLVLSTPDPAAPLCQPASAQGQPKPQHRPKRPVIVAASSVTASTGSVGGSVSRFSTPPTTASSTSSSTSSPTGTSADSSASSTVSAAAGQLLHANASFFNDVPSPESPDLPNRRQKRQPVVQVPMPVPLLTSPPPPSSSSSSSSPADAAADAASVAAPQRHDPQEIEPQGRTLQFNDAVVAEQQHVTVTSTTDSTAPVSETQRTATSSASGTGAPAAVEATSSPAAPSVSFGRARERSRTREPHQQSGVLQQRSTSGAGSSSGSGEVPVDAAPAAVPASALPPLTSPPRAAGASSSSVNTRMPDPATMASAASNTLVGRAAGFSSGSSSSGASGVHAHAAPLLRPRRAQSVGRAKEDLRGRGRSSGGNRGRSKTSGVRGDDAVEEDAGGDDDDGFGDDIHRGLPIQSPQTVGSRRDSGTTTGGGGAAGSQTGEAASALSGSGGGGMARGRSLRRLGADPLTTPPPGAAAIGSIGGASTSKSPRSASAPEYNNRHRGVPRSGASRRTDGTESPPVELDPTSMHGIDDDVIDTLRLLADARRMIDDGEDENSNGDDSSRGVPASAAKALLSPPPAASAEIALDGDGGSGSKESAPSSPPLASTASSDSAASDPATAAASTEAASGTVDDAHASAAATAPASPAPTLPSAAAAASPSDSIITTGTTDESALLSASTSSAPPLAALAAAATGSGNLQSMLALLKIITAYHGQILKKMREMKMTLVPAAIGGNLKEAIIKSTKSLRAADGAISGLHSTEDQAAVARDVAKMVQIETLVREASADVVECESAFQAVREALIERSRQKKQTRLDQLNGKLKADKKQQQQQQAQHSASGSGTAAGSSTSSSSGSIAGEKDKAATAAAAGTAANAVSSGHPAPTLAHPTGITRRITDSSVGTEGSSRSIGSDFGSSSGASAGNGKGKGAGGGHPGRRDSVMTGVSLGSWAGDVPVAEGYNRKVRGHVQHPATASHSSSSGSIGSGDAYQRDASKTLVAKLVAAGDLAMETPKETDVEKASKEMKAILEKAEAVMAVSKTSPPATAAAAGAPAQATASAVDATAADDGGDDILAVKLAKTTSYSSSRQSSMRRSLSRGRNNGSSNSLSSAGGGSPLRSASSASLSRLVHTNSAGIDVTATSDTLADNSGGITTRTSTMSTASSAASNGTTGTRLGEDLRSELAMSLTKSGVNLTLDTAEAGDGKAAAEARSSPAAAPVVVVAAPAEAAAAIKESAAPPAAAVADPTETATAAPAPESSTSSASSSASAPSSPPLAPLAQPSQPQLPPDYPMHPWMAQWGLMQPPPGALPGAAGAPGADGTAASGSPPMPWPGYPFYPPPPWMMQQAAAGGAGGSAGASPAGGAVPGAWPGFPFPYGPQPPAAATTATTAAAPAPAAAQPPAEAVVAAPPAVAAPAEASPSTSSQAAAAQQQTTSFKSAAPEAAPKRSASASGRPPAAPASSAASSASSAAQPPAQSSSNRATSSNNSASNAKTPIQIPPPTVNTRIAAGQPSPGLMGLSPDTHAEGALAALALERGISPAYAISAVTSPAARADDESPINNGFSSPMEPRGKPGAGPAAAPAAAAPAPAKKGWGAVRGSLLPAAAPSSSSKQGESANAPAATGTTTSGGSSQKNNDRAASSVSRGASAERSDPHRSYRDHPGIAANVLVDRNSRNPGSSGAPPAPAPLRATSRWGISRNDSSNQILARGRSFDSNNDDDSGSVKRGGHRESSNSHSVAGSDVDDTMAGLNGEITEYDSVSQIGGPSAMTLMQKYRDSRDAQQQQQQQQYQQQQKQSSGGNVGQLQRGQSMFKVQPQGSSNNSNGSGTGGSEHMLSAAAMMQQQLQMQQQQAPSAPVRPIDKLRAGGKTVASLLSRQGSHRDTFGSPDGNTMNSSNPASAASSRNLLAGMNSSSQSQQATQQPAYTKQLLGPSLSDYTGVMGDSSLSIGQSSSGNGMHQGQQQYGMPAMGRTGSSGSGGAGGDGMTSQYSGARSGGVASGPGMPSSAPRSAPASAEKDRSGGGGSVPGGMDPVKHLKLKTAVAAVLGLSSGVRGRERERDMEEMSTSGPSRPNPALSASRRTTSFGVGGGGGYSGSSVIGSPDPYSSQQQQSQAQQQQMYQQQMYQQQQQQLQQQQMQQQQMQMQQQQMMQPQMQQMPMQQQQLGSNAVLSNSGRTLHPTATFRGGAASVAPSMTSASGPVMPGQRYPQQLGGASSVGGRSMYLPQQQQGMMQPQMGQMPMQQQQGLPYTQSVYGGQAMGGGMMMGGPQQPMMGGMGGMQMGGGGGGGGGGLGVGMSGVVGAASAIMAMQAATKNKASMRMSTTSNLKGPLPITVMPKHNTSIYVGAGGGMVAHADGQVMIGSGRPRTPPPNVKGARLPVIDDNASVGGSTIVESVIRAAVNRGR